MSQQLLLLFFRPYVAFLIGAAYSIEQTMEGLGWSSSNFLVFDEQGQVINGYWSPAEAMLAPLGVLVLLSAALCVCTMLAGYCLRRKKGALTVLLVWLLPGLLSLLGLWPHVDTVPEVFVLLSAGELGNAWGMAALVLIALLIGWVVIILATYLLGLRDRFRHWYDHVWYSLAVLAGIFFVADSRFHQVDKDIAESASTVREASAYLLRQVRDIETDCRGATIPNSPACVWSRDVQQLLLEIAHYDHRVYASVGPESIEAIYSPFGAATDDVAVDSLRQELQEYNNHHCPVAVLSENMRRGADAYGRCQQTPAQFCAAVERDQFDRMLLSTAVANECIVPTLVMLRSRLSKLVEASGRAEQAKHWKYLFYLFVSVLAGGKIANATARAMSVGHEAKLWTLLRAGAQFAYVVWAFAWSVLIGALKVVMLIPGKVAGLRGSIRRGESVTIEEQVLES